MTSSLKWSISEGALHLAAEAWDALVSPDDPFLEHGFLAALERSGSVGTRAGWQPRFILCHRGPDLVGAVPLYLKDHSYGEFIFDWGWAGAAERAGLSYYPKLVAAVPHTPVTGDRLLVRSDERRDEVTEVLALGMATVAEQTDASSIHVLFCRESESAELEAAGYHARLSFQFHWENRTPEPYRDFDDYLSAFRSTNRKQVRKERARAREHGLRLATVPGVELRPRDWQAIERLYLENAANHGSIPYLNTGFFALMRETFAHRIVATLAFDGDEAVAGTLNFERGKNLFGRYWGTTRDAEMLHFELCYYGLIERAIARGCTRFEAGAQGEHKLKRGLVPKPTYSAHRMIHGGLDRAVAGFIREEALQVKQRIALYAGHTPYREHTPGTNIEGR